LHPLPSQTNLPLDSSADTPRRLWNDYFKKRTPSPSDVAKTVLQLHLNGRHEHVIAAVQAALIYGQAQPWMYEVLALSMEITGRPKEQIERVLLSRVDLTATDVYSMMYSAAYLTRFGGDRLALRLYRQASRLEPTRPEPYVLGLKLARRQKDYDALRWAATGILITVWTKDRQQLHEQAEDAAAEAELLLRKAGRNDEADALKTAMVQARRRDLVVRLVWAGEGDLDLIVEEPPGTVCSLQNPQSRGGGVLLHDGYGPNQQNCYEEYVCAFGAPGNYRLRVKHLWGNIVGKRAQLEVTRYLGTPHESVRRYPVLLGRRDTVVRLALNRGRRTGLSPARRRTLSHISPRRPSRKSLSQLISPSSTELRQIGQQFNQSRQQALGLSSTGIGYQPVTSVISEGVTLNALAVISGDRRYVRISTTPVFRSLTDVFTFSFINSGNPTRNPGVGGTTAAGNVGGTGN